MFETFGEITEAIKSDSSLPFKVVVEGMKYMKVEDSEGNRVYIQLESFRPHDKLANGFEIFVSGRTKGLPVSATLDDIVSQINETLKEARERAFLAKRRMHVREVNRQIEWLKASISYI